MDNQPHPGLVLREYLGDLAVSKVAARLRITRVTLSRVLNGRAGNFSLYGDPAGGCFGHHARVVDEYAVAV